MVCIVFVNLELIFVFCIVVIEVDVVEATKNLMKKNLKKPKEGDGKLKR